MALPNRLAKAPVTMQMRMPDGTLRPRQIYRHHCTLTEDVSAQYPKFGPAFEWLGATKPVKFGNASSILCDAKKIHAVCERLIPIEPDAILTRDALPEHWYK